MSLVSNQIISVHDLVQTYLNEFPEHFEPTIRHRLEMALIAFADGTRTKVATVEMLMRPLKVGGVEIERTAAEQLLNEFEQRLRKSREEMETKSEESETKITTTENKTLDAFTVEDQKDIEALQQKQAIELTEPFSFDAVVKTLCEHETFQFKNEDEQKRCRIIVDARVRGVRSAFETRAQFERLFVEGGLDVHGRKLADVMETIEQTISTYEQEIQTQLDAQKREMVQKKIERRATKTTQEIGKHHEVQQQIIEHVDPKAIQNAIKHSVLPPQVSHFRPQMTDIQPMKRLMGPIDQLAAMTLMDFRRLSKDPTIAITKLIDLVELVEEQGHGQREKAVQAWRRSPLNRLYLETMAQTMSGEQKKRQKEASLTVEELQAVRKINGMLRF